MLSCKVIGNDRLWFVMSPISIGNTCGHVSDNRLGALNLHDAFSLGWVQLMTLPNFGYNILSHSFVSDHS